LLFKYFDNFRTPKTQAASLFTLIILSTHNNMNNVIKNSKLEVLVRLKNLVEARLIVFIILTLVFTNCKKSEPEPPSARIEFLTPTSGNVPSLAVHLKLSGVQGTDPIIRYKLHVDDKVAFSYSPIDTTIVFSTGNYNIYGEVVDAGGLSGKTSVTPISVTYKLPSFNLSVSDVDGISPLSSRLKITVTQGSSPIKEYKIFISGRGPYNRYSLKDKIILNSRPIDTLITLYAGTYNLYGEIIDDENYTVKTSEMLIEVHADPNWDSFFDIPIEGPINLFETPGFTPQEIEYNAIKTKEARDAILPGKVESDISSKIMGTNWSCGKVAQLFCLNSRNFGKDIYENPLNLLPIYEGYDGDNLDSILFHGGTTKYFGTLGLSSGMVEIIGFLHAMNYVVTGDDLSDPDSYNFIDAQPAFKATNVKPGQFFFPLNCDTLRLIYYYVNRDVDGLHVKNLGTCLVARLKIVNGEVQFVGINPNIEIFRTREEAKNYRK